MVFDVGWASAFVEDEDGEKYFICREYKKSNSNFVFFLKVILSLEKEDQIMFPNPGESFLGYIHYEMDDKNNLVHLEPMYPGNVTFSLDMTPETLRLVDANGQVELNFKILSPGLEFYLPGQIDKVYDIQYRSVPYWVEGSISGKAVSGFGGLDVSFTPPGADYRQQKIHGYLEQFWIVWLNKYENGDIETGIFVKGKESFCVGHYNLNGNARVTHHHDIQVKTLPDGFCIGADFKMDELYFRYVADSRSLVGTSVKFDDATADAQRMEADDTDWGVGHVVNLNEKKKPIWSIASNEFCPQRLDSIKK